MSPGISVIIPVLHEGAGINALIEHVRSQEAPVPVEIIVVDGGGGDTIQAIDSEDIVKIQSGRGRGLQMNRGAAVARGDILLFLHADTFLPEGGIRKIVDVLSQERYVGGAFDLGIDSDHWFVKATEKVGTIRSRITRLPYGDQAIFIRKEFFDTIGRYKHIPLMEDVDLMQRVKKGGGTIRFIPDRVRTSARRWENEGPFFGTFRNWLLISLYFLGVPPDRLARFYPADVPPGRDSGASRS